MIPSIGGGGHPMDLVVSLGARFCRRTESGWPVSSDGLESLASAVRCAPPQNEPTRIEFARCQPYLEREVALLRRLRMVVVLGAVAMQAFLRTWRATGHDVPSPVPKFRHGGTWLLPPITLIATYHPSQRNTQTGRLTQSMLDRVFESVQTVRSKDHAR